MPAERVSIVEARFETADKEAMPAPKFVSNLAVGSRIERFSLTDQAYRRIKRLLMTGAVEPGRHLVLRDVARQLGISVTPVREALLQLVAEKSLELFDRGSIRVPLLSLPACLELWRIRLLLEGECTEAAAANTSAELIESLTKSHQAMVAAKQARRLSDALLHNMEFHFALYRAANLPLLLALIEDIWARSAAYVRFFHETHVEGRTTAAKQGPHMHATVIAAMAAGDPVRARKGVERDLLEIREGITKLLSEQQGAHADTIAPRTAFSPEVPRRLRRAAGKRLP
jgi:DNA-binding GntR family transcriptional regulator